MASFTSLLILTVVKFMIDPVVVRDLVLSMLISWYNFHDIR